MRLRKDGDGSPTSKRGVGQQQKGDDLLPEAANQRKKAMWRWQIRRVDEETMS